MAKATEHGFKLTKPWGENSPYDFVVDLGGRFVSVQVKSTMCQVRPREGYERPGCFAVRLHKGGSLLYKASDFHCLAVYVIAKDAWYIIPFALVFARTAIRLSRVHTKIVKVASRYSQRELQNILQASQPRISDLLRGKMSKFSLEMLVLLRRAVGIGDQYQDPCSNTGASAGIANFAL